MRVIQGCTAGELKCFSCADLLAAKFTPADMRGSGWSAREMAEGGIPLAELHSIGFSAEQLYATGIFTISELREVGYLVSQCQWPSQLQDSCFIRMMTLCSSANAEPI